MKKTNPQLEQPAPTEFVAERKGLLTKLNEGLQRTRANLTAGLATAFLGKKAIDEVLLEEIETRLLLADVGVETTHSIIETLTTEIARKELADVKTLFPALKRLLTDILMPCAKPFLIDAGKKPFVVLMVGVNGAGKTTTIGKLVKHLQEHGKTIMLAAGDTFRAAAVEQLQIWGKRHQVPVIAQQHGADSAAVIFDALQSAKARHVDVLIADTAGRLHTQSHLMEELKKIKRVIQKADATAPHEVMLVLDAGIGQNAIQQAKQFNEAVGVTGIALTKLDGTAKGGIIFALAKQMQLPLRFIGVGEDADDLQPFDAGAFVQALFKE